MKHLTIKYQCQTGACSNYLKTWDYKVDSVDGLYTLPGQVLCAECLFEPYPISKTSMPVYYKVTNSGN